MAVNHEELQDIFRFLQSAFTLAMGLALGESFKQFIGDKEDKKIHWNRLPALLGFLVLMIPYLGGMSHYFFISYVDPLRKDLLSKDYGRQIVIDEIVFIYEAGMFFVCQECYLHQDRLILI